MVDGCVIKLMIVVYFIHENTVILHLILMDITNTVAYYLIIPIKSVSITQNHYSTIYLYDGFLMMHSTHF